MWILWVVFFPASLDVGRYGLGFSEDLSYPWMLIRSSSYILCCVLSNPFAPCRNVFCVKTGVLFVPLVAADGTASVLLRPRTSGPRNCTVPESGLLRGRPSNGLYIYASGKGPLRRRGGTGGVRALGCTVTSTT